MGLRLAEKRMEMEERLGRDSDRQRDRDWDRRWDQDWDQDRRRDRYGHNDRGNYDSRDHRFYGDLPQRSLPIQSVYFFKGGNAAGTDVFVSGNSLKKRLVIKQESPAR